MYPVSFVPSHIFHFGNTQTHFLLLLFLLYLLLAVKRTSKQNLFAHSLIKYYKHTTKKWKRKKTKTKHRLYTWQTGYLFSVQLLLCNRTRYEISVKLLNIGQGKPFYLFGFLFVLDSIVFFFCLFSIDFCFCLKSKFWREKNGKSTNFNHLEKKNKTKQKITEFERKENVHTTNIH